MKFRLDLPKEEICDTPEAVDRLLADLYTNIDSEVALDTETSGLEFDARVYLITLAFRQNGTGRRVLIPVHRPSFFQFFDKLKPWLEDPDCRKRLLFHNALYDIRVLHNHGIEVQGLYADTMKLHHLYEEEDAHDLKSVSYTLLGLKLLPFTEIFGSRGRRSGNDDVAQTYDDPNRRDAAIEYATRDPWATLEIYEFLRERLERIRWKCPKSLREDNKKTSLWDLHQTIDVPFIQVLTRMTITGIKLDRDYLRDREAPAERALAEITQEVSNLYHRPINLGSPTQIASLLFDQLKLQPKKRTKTGFSTDESVLEALSAEGESVAAKILRYRKINKTLGTYLKGLSKWIAKDGRVHSSFSSTAVTSRVKSSDPALMNIPRADEDEFKIRGAFVARDGYVLVCADYSNLEMRIAAALFGDEGLIQAIKEDKDLHAANAADMYHLPYEDFIEAKAAKKKGIATEYQEHLLHFRQATKRTGFLILYGGGPFRLATQLAEDTGTAVTIEKAKQDIEDFLDARPGIADGIEWCKRYALEHGYVLDALGRRRRPKGLFVASKAEQAEALRQSVNYPIQSTASGLVTQAMLHVEKDRQLRDMDAIQILQVHDEILLEVPEDCGKDALVRLRQIMINPDGWPGLPDDVPIEVEGGIARSWMEAK